MWILPKTAKLLTIYNTLESLEDLATQDSITLKSIRLSNNDYDLDGVQVRVSPYKADKLLIITLDINRTKIDVPAFYDILTVIDSTYVWSSIMRLGKESVFIASNHVFSSFPISMLSYVEKTDVECYQLELNDRKPIFIGERILNTNGRGYTAIAINSK